MTVDFMNASVFFFFFFFFFFSVGVTSHFIWHSLWAQGEILVLFCE